MIIGPKLIAVDDNADDLAVLAEGFSSMGGSCHTLLYDKAVDGSGPFRPGIRIIFLDINMLPGAADDSAARTYSPIMQTIRGILPQDNGPYALVTWTENPNKHDSLIAFLQTNLEPHLHPCADFCLDKSEYLEDVPRLADRLRNMRQDLPGFGMLLEWEQAVVSAADQSVTEIVNLTAQHGRAAGSSVIDSVKSIGAATAGVTEALHAPFRAFSTGMVSVLTDKLDNVSPDRAQETEWARLVNAAPSRRLNLQQNASLNTFLHVAQCQMSDESGPGTVYEIRVGDFLEYLKPKFSSAREGVLAEEFFPLKQAVKSPETPEHRATKAEFLTQMNRGAISWRFIQLGAFCDQVQGKSRVCTGVLAARVPEKLIKYTELVYKRREYRETPGNLEWLFQTPMLLDNKEKFVLVANLRFNLVFSINEVKCLKSRFRLREQLAVKLSQVNSRYNTRIGLVEFRGN